MLARRTRSIAGLALAAVAVGLLAVPSSAQPNQPNQPVQSIRPPKPALACDEPVHDFGTVSDAAPVTHSFTLWNRGSAHLVISNVRACCGGKAKAAANEVAPGTNTAIEVELAVSGQSGSQDRTVYVVSNDPRQPCYRLRLTGRVVPRVEMEPSSVDLRDLSPNSSTSVVLKVSSLLVGGTPTNAVPDVGWLKASVGARHGETTPVTLTTVPPLPKGVSQGRVRILFPDAAVPGIDLPVTLSVPQEITVLPPELVLAWEPDGKPATRYLMLTSARSEAFRVLRVDCPFPGWTSEAKPAGPGSWRIRLDNVTIEAGDKGTQTAEARDTMDGSMLTITTDHPACPEVAVPVRVVEP